MMAGAQEQLFFMNCMFPNLESVSPVTPAAGYLGGKRNLARPICSIIEQVEHDGYAEPCVGMGGIFFRRKKRPKGEYINDISGDVTTLFRVVRRHYQAFVDELEWMLASRDEFDRLKRVDPDTLTDIERAARFLYLQRLRFGGVPRNKCFGVQTGTGARFNAAKLRIALQAIRDRLQPVVIERLSYGDFIARYDRPGMLFYIDPPYFGCERDYGRGIFSRADFALMAAQLGGIAGKFLLSINDTPQIRECFAGFPMMAVETSYSIATQATGRTKKAGELLIANFPLDGAAGGALAVKARP